MNHIKSIMLFAILVNLFYIQNSIASDSYDTSSASFHPENLNKMYHSDYNNFWSFFNEATKKAVSCDNISYTAEFLKISKSMNNNAEVKEAFLQVMEQKLLIDKTECFLNSLLTIDSTYVDIILNDLKHPTFIDEYVVREKLQKMYLNEKYKILLQPFFDNS